jgi:TrmH family RNA methyltransferase
VVESLQAEVFSVPGCGAIDSLNLASVVNLCAYELTR